MADATLGNMREYFFPAFLLYTILARSATVKFNQIVSEWGFFLRILRDFVISQLCEALIGLAVALDGLVPHGGRAHPNAEITVKRAVDDHFFQRLRMPCEIENFVLPALEMAVPAGFYRHKNHVLSPPV